LDAEERIAALEAAAFKIQNTPSISLICPSEPSTSNILSAPGPAQSPALRTSTFPSSSNANVKPPPTLVKSPFDSLSIQKYKPPIRGKSLFKIPQKWREIKSSLRIPPKTVPPLLFKIATQEEKSFSKSRPSDLPFPIPDDPSKSFLFKVGQIIRRLPSGKCDFPVSAV
jgi:hypothetical protein